MKKLILIFILIPALVFGAGLDGKTYQMPLDGEQFNLCFGTDTVTVSKDDWSTQFGYTYADPIGDIDGIKFYTSGKDMELIASSVTATDITPLPPPPPQPTDPIDLSKVKWLHTNVSSWPITADLAYVKIGTTTIELKYDKACVWPGVNIDGIDLNANPWIFVSLDDIWYAATWEWMKVCQTVKNLYAVNGDHIKVPPLDTWSPISGETYYFMVSGLARQNQRNVKERSNMVKVIWP